MIRNIFELSNKIFQILPSLEDSYHLPPTKLSIKFGVNLVQYRVGGTGSLNQTKLKQNPMLEYILHNAQE